MSEQVSETAMPEVQQEPVLGSEVAALAVQMPPAGPPQLPAVISSGQPPQQPAQQEAVAVGTMFKRRNMFAVWLGLPLITLGIYNLVWWYKINAEMAAFDRRNPVNPAATLMAFLFGWLLIVPPYLAVYGTGQRIADRQRAAGLPPTCSPALGIVFMFVFGLHTLYYQAELNKIVARYGAFEGAQVSLAA